MSNATERRFLYLTAQNKSVRQTLTHAEDVMYLGDLCHRYIKADEGVFRQHITCPSGSLYGWEKVQ